MDKCVNIHTRLVATTAGHFCLGCGDVVTFAAPADTQFEPQVAHIGSTRAYYTPLEKHLFTIHPSNQLEYTQTDITPGF